jgi:uncharacterized protein (TIGR03435 family)
MPQQGVGERASASTSATRTLAFAVVILLITGSALLAQTRRPRFHFVSIKRHTTGAFESGPPLLSQRDELAATFVDTPLRTLIAAGYPALTPPQEIDGLPSWADAERYDVIAKFRAGTPVEQQAQMWRTLLVDRMNLAAHYELRKRPGYRLVMARNDRKLGPGIQPAAADCAREEIVGAQPTGADDPLSHGLNRCGIYRQGDDGTLTGVAVPMGVLVHIIERAVDAPVIDRTGLRGNFNVTMTLQLTPVPADHTSSPDDMPTVFAGLPEQLGLRLEPEAVPVRVLAVDHIERIRVD